jgi:hypothetical protein
MDYLTRRLRAGGEFDCPANEALVYEQIGLAVPVMDEPPAVPVKPQAPRPPAPPALPVLPVIEENPEVARLAAEYERITGNKPDKRWRETRLQSEIDAHNEGTDTGED